MRGVPPLGFEAPPRTLIVEEPFSVSRTREGFRIGAGVLVPSGVRLSLPIGLHIGRGAVIDGGVFAAGAVSTAPHVRVHGPVRAAGSVVLGAGSKVGGDVEAGGDARILPDGRVGGAVRAEGDVHLFSGARVDGVVEAGGDIVVWGRAATGTLRPGGRVRTETWPAPESVAAERGEPS